MSISYGLLLPRLGFGREREGIDLSKIVLTHLSPGTVPRPNALRARQGGSQCQRAGWVLRSASVSTCAGSLAVWFKSPGSPTDMKSAIVEKLERELASTPDTEPRVVYFLCQVRKLLEMEGFDRAPKDLKLFCHWALHTDLGSPGTTKHFLERMDQVLVNYLESDTGEDIAMQNALFRELLYFRTLRHELRTVLQSYGLSTRVCDDDAEWSVFLQAYTGVIEDGTLTAGLRWVDGARFTRKAEISTFDNPHLPFEMIWKIRLKQPYKGFQTLSISVSGTADGGFVASSFGVSNEVM